MNLEHVFGEDHFIRRIPESELSTPEDYLKSNIDLTAPSTQQPLSPSKDGSSETIPEEGEDYDIDEIDPEDPEEPLTNEETPLLSDDKL